MELPLIYFCNRCQRYTDVRYISDKEGGRSKSYCYKCFREDLEPVELKEYVYDDLKVIPIEKDNVFT